MSTKKISSEEYKKKLLKYYNGNIVNLEKYKTNKYKILHRCNVCGYEWLMTPNRLLQNSGCFRCRKMKSKNEIKLLFDNYNFIEPYFEKDYYKKIEKINFLCKKCKTISKTFYSKLYNDVKQNKQMICPKCSLDNGQIKSRKTNEEYKQRLYKLFDKTIINIEPYVKANKKILHKCILCEHQWLRTPNSMIYSKGCPKCLKQKKYSKISIKWLKSLNNKNIIHAENGGEYRIPNTRWHVDGYDIDTNTVYEFLGDKWHGNIKLYNKDKIVIPHGGETVLESYNKTFYRLNKIKEMGFIVKYIWSSDFKDKKPLIIL